MKKFAALCSVVLALSACSESDPVFHDSGSPARLSDWGLFNLDASELKPKSSTEVYLPANQLFTDYAHKLRTLHIPAGSQAQLVDGEIEYPVGTILSKTFYYPKSENGDFLKVTDNTSLEVILADHQLIETRILVHRDVGWEAFPYVWNDEQTEAFLRVAGASKSVSLVDSAGSHEDFVYFVPNGNQCSGCHITSHPDGGMHPLGAIADQLHAKRSALDTELQTEVLAKRGWLDKAPQSEAVPSWRDETLGLEDRALAYLNMHCGHCHNPEGAADTSALILNGSHNALVNLGVCKPPVAAGGGAGDLRYGVVPGDPAESILLYRMGSYKPDEMMPELGRSLVHKEGLALVSDWIESLSGDCG